MAQIIVPDLGEGVERVEVVVWHKQVGDRVQAGEDLVELIADKATFNIAASDSGSLTKISVPQGMTAKIGDVLGEIG